MTTSNTITKTDLTNILNELLPVVQHTARVGEISMFAGSTAPSGWLICDGSAVSRTTYSELFAVIGTTYGTGDGSTTFNLPDFRNNFPVGAGSTYSLNSKGGANTVTLNIDNIPSHSHTIPNSLPNYAAPASGGWLTGVGGSNNSYNTGSTGGSQAHENRPPYIGINFIIYAGTDYPVTNDYDSGWINITPQSPFALYNSDTSCRCRRIGHTVQICAELKTTTIIPTGTEKTMFTLPEGFRPLCPIIELCQGSGMNIWMCRIQPNGAVLFNRHRSGATEVQAETWQWFPIYFSFLVE